LESEGHEVFVFARRKDIAIELLGRYEIPHTVLAGKSESLAGLAFRQAQYELGIFNRARKIDPDVMVAMSEPGVAHTSVLLGCPSILFTDTEHAWLQNMLAFPFADVVCTPECFRDDIGPKQVRYPSYHELAYLHPNRFEPDETVLEDVGVDSDGDVVLVRLGDWSSSHDVGVSGIDDPVALVREIEETGAEVLLSTEGDLPEGLGTRGFSLEPDRFHDLLAAIDLYVGEGGTTAAECAVLGTPAVYVSDLALGYLDELESTYDLVVNCTDEGSTAAASEAARDALSQPERVFRQRRLALLSEKGDPTDIILEQLTGETSDTRDETPPETPTRNVG
jgi:predicted glycosyltransferase